MVNMSIPASKLAARLELFALAPFPRVQTGDDVANLVRSVLSDLSLTLYSNDVLILAQKIISKAEGRRVRLDSVEPSPRAEDLAQRTGKDARLVELILRESNEVVRVGRDVIIVEHLNGYVLANAGIDQSNVSENVGSEEALLLPVDPDRSALLLRKRLQELTGVAPAIIINDSWGRAWRRGVVGHAIGVAGLEAVVDQRGRLDLNGRPLRATEVALADELAAAGSLLMGQADEGRPAILVRGLILSESTHGARALMRPRAEDLFR